MFKLFKTKMLIAALAVTATTIVLTGCGKSEKCKKSKQHKSSNVKQSKKLKKNKDWMNDERK